MGLENKLFYKVGNHTKKKHPLSAFIGFIINMIIIQSEW